MRRQAWTLVVLFCLIKDYFFDCMIDFGKMWRQVETLVVYISLSEAHLFEYLALLVFVVIFQIILGAAGRHRTACAICQVTWDPAWSLRQNSPVSNTEIFRVDVYFLMDQVENW